MGGFVRLPGGRVYRLVVEQVTLTPDQILQLIYALLGAGVIYGGIRADLRAMHERIEAAQSAATRAHERIDTIIMRGDHG